MACTWNETNRILPMDDKVVLLCPVVSGKLAIAYNISAPSHNLLDILLLDEQNYNLYSKDNDWGCLSKSLCYFDAANVSSMIEIESKSNQTLFVVISNENLFASVYLNYSISIVLNSKANVSRASNIFLRIAIILFGVTLLLALIGAIVWWRRRLVAARSIAGDTNNVPLITPDGEANEIGEN